MSPSVAVEPIEVNAPNVKMPKPKIFFPNLDGLRFFCFLSVFLFHSFATDYDSVKENALYKFTKGFLAANGNLGVNFFFVLSGFLITYLLLAERSYFNKIKIGSFYARRFLRIWPLFYFCVLFGFYAFPYLKSLFGETPDETADIIYYITFLNNFDFIEKGLPDASMLGVLWSVAIEEQFYLFWPLLIILFKRNTLLLFIAIITGSFLFRVFNADQPIILEHHTFSCISDMSIGGLGAYLVFKSDKIKRRIELAPQYLIILLYLSVIAIYFFREQIFHHGTVLLSLDRLVISVIFLMVILEQCFSKNSLFKMQNYKLTSKLGSYTYGLYCLHFFGILISAKLLGKLGFNKTVYQVIFLEGGLSLLLTVGLAIFSYRYYEMPFLKLKEKFARIRK